jgi:predicted anti-sigma-YlaC factor YlaD
MHCLDAQTALEAYVDKVLDPEQIGLLETHLAECESCRAELAYLQTAERALETWPLVAEPAEFTTRVMARIEPRPEIPRFRLRWSDVAISLAGASLAISALPLWQLLESADLAQSLQDAHDALRLKMLPLEMLQLDISLRLQPLIKSGALVWLPILAGIVFAFTILPVMGFSLSRSKKTLS